MITYGPLTRRAFAAALCAALTTGAVAASRYEFRRAADPDGIAKYYRGRQIAQVMGHQAADWLDRPEREAEEAPKRLVEMLKLKEGERAADVGAGSGYFTFLMAPKVGQTGVVYAVDIQPEMLAIIANRAKGFGYRQVKPVRGTITDPRLPAGTVDTILMVDVYHEFSHPWEMTQSMVRSLKPGGRIVFVEYRAEDPNVPIKAVHKMTEAQVKREMTAFPQLKFETTLRDLPRQHVMVFRKATPPTK